jgi:hypothetical protein
MAANRHHRPALMGTAVLVCLPCVCLPCVAQSGLVTGESQSDTQTQNASISGIVQSDAGPLKYARVSAYQVVTSEGWASLARKCSIETDSKGSYRCNGLMPGSYFVLASGGDAPEQKSKPKQQVSSYAFFPSAGDLEEAGEIVVRSGQLQSADIFVGRIGGRPRYVHATLLAKTRGRDGTLVADTGIRADYDEQSGEVRFEGVPHGTFEAMARWRAGNEFHFSEAEVSVQGANVAGISLDELRNVSVEGTVTVDSGSSDAKVALSRAVLERAFDTDVPFEPASIDARIDTNGSFRFPSVLPGRYFFKVASDPQVFVASSSIAGLSRNGSMLVIASSAEGVTVQVDVSTQVGSIGGVVTDLPEGNAKAGVLVQSVDTGQISTTTADQSGKFMVTGLAPGDYRIYSWPDLSHLAYRDPGVLNEYADSAGEVILQSGAMNQSVNVNLIQEQ